MDHLLSLFYQLTHPWHWFLYGNNAAGVQALCSILGIAGLLYYAFETRLIRLATFSQARANQRPFLVFYDSDNSSQVCSVLNEGEGPVSNSYWKVGTQNTLPSKHSPHGWVRLGAFGKGQGSHLPLIGKLSSLEVMGPDGLRVHYADTAGNWYWLTCSKGVTNEFFQDSGELIREEANPVAIRKRRAFPRI